MITSARSRRRRTMATSVFCPAMSSSNAARRKLSDDELGGGSVQPCPSSETLTVTLTYIPITSAFHHRRQIFDKPSTPGSRRLSASVSQTFPVSAALRPDSGHAKRKSTGTSAGPGNTRNWPLSLQFGSDLDKHESQIDAGERTSDSSSSTVSRPMPVERPGQPGTAVRNLPTMPVAG